MFSSFAPGFGQFMEGQPLRVAVAHVGTVGVARHDAPSVACAKLCNGTLVG
jgi:hypothetical protein